MYTFAVGRRSREHCKKWFGGVRQAYEGYRDRELILQRSFLHSTAARTHLREETVL